MMSFRDGEEGIGMENEFTNYYERLGAAYVRGISVAKKEFRVTNLCRAPFNALTEEEIRTLFRTGMKTGLKMYRFKRTHENLPRVRRVLGILKSLQFGSLIDVGSGRGVFLFPFLDQFPWVAVTALDIRKDRTEFLEAVHRGGIENLTVLNADICTFPFPENSVDAVTMLEVLEHIPSVEKAVEAAVRMARKYVVVTVPSKEDNNPEHIHLLTKKKLTDLFQSADCERLHFDGVNGHLIMIAMLEKENGKDG